MRIVAAAALTHGRGSRRWAPAVLDGRGGGRNPARSPPPTSPTPVLHPLLPALLLLPAAADPAVAPDAGPDRDAVADRAGGGNFGGHDPALDGDRRRKLGILADLLPARIGRVNLYPHSFLRSPRDPAPTPETADELILAFHARGLEPVFLFEYYPAQLRDAGWRITPAVWRRVGEAFAARFRPNSPFLRSRGVTDWGVTTYTAMNEPDLERFFPPTAADAAPETRDLVYAEMIEAFADGVHAAGPGLKANPGGFANPSVHKDFTLRGYGPALAPLYRDGTLHALDLHIYNDARYAPIEEPGGRFTFWHSPQTYFDKTREASGLPGDTAFASTEYGFKVAAPAGAGPAERAAAEDAAAKRLLTVIWANHGLVEADGETPATESALIWQAFADGADEPVYGLLETADPPRLNALGKTYQLALTLAEGMRWASLYPHARGEYVLEKDGAKLWVWQNLPAWSELAGSTYTVTETPPGRRRSRCTVTTPTPAHTAASRPAGRRR